MESSSTLEAMDEIASYSLRTNKDRSSYVFKYPAETYEIIHYAQWFSEFYFVYIIVSSYAQSNDEPLIASNINEFSFYFLYVRITKKMNYIKKKHRSSLKNVEADWKRALFSLVMLNF